MVAGGSRGAHVARLASAGARARSMAKNTQTSSLHRKVESNVHAGFSCGELGSTAEGVKSSGHVFMTAFGTFPTGLDRTRKVCRGIFASTSILWSVRSVLVNLGRSTDVYFTRWRPLTAYTPSRRKKISTVKPTKKAVLSPWRAPRPTYLPRHRCTS